MVHSSFFYLELWQQHHPNFWRGTCTFTLQCLWVNKNERDFHKYYFIWLNYFSIPLQIHNLIVQAINIIEWVTP